MKTSELNGAALDWAVAKIEFPDPDYEDDDRLVYVYGDDEFHFTPSTDWAQGGPIIEREGIAVTCTPEEWCAYSNGGEHPIGLTRKRGFRWTGKQVGPTPLIAAMRCFVASRLGDDVEIPNELQGEKQ